MQLRSALMHCSSWHLLICSVVVVATVGCGDQGPKTYRVRGTVTWNGAPIPEGDIIFSPVDGQSVPGAGKIKDGKYELKVAPGDKKVEVHASREAPEKDNVMGAAPRLPYIPAKFNAETELTASVQANDENIAEFSLVE